MRQSIRALGWTITISMLLLLGFLATAVYSVSQTFLLGQGIGFGGFQTTFSDNRLMLSVPITVNNTGCYDMSDFTITTTLKDYNGAALGTDSTVIPEIKKGQTVSRLHSLSLSLTEVLSHLAYLLFNDTEFKIDFSIGFKYAYALGFQLALVNVSVPWGAPLYGLALKEVGLPSFNGTHLSMNAVLEAENHSFLDIVGNLTFKVYNEVGESIGSGTGLVNLPSGSRLTEPVQVVIYMADPLSFTGGGYVEIYFALPMVEQTFELGRIHYG